MKFFFDNNLSPDIARGMAELRHSFDEEIVHLKDKFDDESIEDAEWLADLIEEGGWSVVSADRFKKSSAERRAIRHPRLNVFILSKSFVKLKRWEKTKVIVRQWENISKMASASIGGVHEVRNSGKITTYQL